MRPTTGLVTHRIAEHPLTLTGHDHFRSNRKVAAHIQNVETTQMTNSAIDSRANENSQTTTEETKREIDPGKAAATFLEEFGQLSEAARIAEQTRDSSWKSANKRYETLRSEIAAQLLEAESRDHREFETQLETLARSVQEKLDRLTRSRDEAIRKTEESLSHLMMEETKKRDEIVWHAAASADSAGGSLESQFVQMQRRLRESDSRLGTLIETWTKDGLRQPEVEEEEDLASEVETWESVPLIGEDPPKPDPEPLETAIQELEHADRRLKTSWPHRVLSWKTLPLFAILGGAIGYALESNLWIPMGVFTAAGIVGVVLQNRRFGRHLEHSEAKWRDCRVKLESLRNAMEFWYGESKKSIERKLKEARESATSQAENAILQAQEKAAAEMAKTASAYESSVATLKSKADHQKASLESDHKSRLLTLQAQAQERTAAGRLAHEGRLEEIDRQFRQELDEIRKRRTLAAQRTDTVLQRWKNWRDRYAPDWNARTDWLSDDGFAGALLLGLVRIPEEKTPILLKSEADEHSILPDLSEIPAVWQVPGPKSTLWIQAPPGRRSAANSLLQTLALRALTAFPPGQSKFTLIDPVGLGQSFSGLLHLADFEPSLVNQRPWSEARDIEARLAELTMHLEFVVQNYLRNQYETIEDYNRDAGEVAEPYRFLVIADWPAAITEESARRLRRLIEAGGRCGIYVILGHDLSMPGPIDPMAPDLRGRIERLIWSTDKNRWSWPAHPLDSHIIQWQEPPDPNTMTTIVRTIGAAARKAMRVEVPFSVVAPPEGEIWNASTSHGIEIPLGRAGARQLQSLRLGEGTSQHMLLAGRTGSGKSTLLHAIATNAALRFSPAELELYLVDFKKGVEFKNYATRDLPHAQVVGVESEREFGLSVLERLDRELTIRGEKFRQAGVQDLAGFRVARSGEHMPRILLIIDEFQELFNEDDRIAGDAATLLDRLVRQGRAFGLHVVLGSQSMAGAYAIARSTIGQMGVRIALQCNENDSRLILSEDNPAARMLSRPGEAIYNDANGLPEGNHLFQAVWISDHDREVQLGKIRQVAEARGWRRSRPMVVFEGNAPGDLKKNAAISAALSPAEARATQPKDGVPAFWPGETVTISDPPAIRFERQPAANLLVVGRQSQEIRAMLSAAVLGILATEPGAEILIVEAPVAGETGLRSACAGMSPNLEFIDPPALKGRLIELHGKLHRRQDDPASATNPIFFFVNDLARLRDLRKSDDDYGFGGFGSGEDAAPSPTKILGELLRDGPVVGIHTILWTDGSISLGHSTDRSALNEFGTIVIFQTTAAESTHFLDHVAASRLDRTQALLVRPAENEQIKIRPYAVIEPELWKSWSGTIRGLIERNGESIEHRSTSGLKNESPVPRLPES